MDFKRITVTEVLNIENVELYQTIGHSGAFITSGTLNLLYSEQHNWYILRVNDFNYGISKRIPVLASHHERGAICAYVVPNPEGYFVIKVTRVRNAQQLYEFENILRSTTELAYKDEQGLPVSIKDQTVIVKRGATPEDQIEERAQTTAAHFIYRGGRATSRFIVGAAEGISHGIARLGNHIHAPEVTKTDEDEALIKPKTASRLAIFNSATGMVTSTSTYYMKGVTSLGNWIGQAIKTTFAKKHEEKEIKKINARTAAFTRNSMNLPTEGVIGIGFATIYSAITIWKGMIEALDIIREGLSETASGIVTQRYGNVAGEVIRAGISVTAGKVRVPGRRFVNRIQ